MADMAVYACFRHEGFGQLATCMMEMDGLQALKSMQPFIPEPVRDLEVWGLAVHATGTEAVIFSDNSMEYG